MNLLAIFAAAKGLAGEPLKQFLEAQIAAHPDFAPLLQPMLDGLTSELTDEHVGNIVDAAPHEFLDILERHIKRRRHAGDSI